MFLFVWGIYFGVELLSQMVNVYLVFEGAAKPFSNVPAPFYVPTPMYVVGSNFPHPCQHLQLCVFFIVASLDGDEVVSHWDFDLHFAND